MWILLLCDVLLLSSGFDCSFPHSANTRRTMDVSRTGIKLIVSDFPNSTVHHDIDFLRMYSRRDIHSWSRAVYHRGY